ncbi:ATP-binding cassette domain-containing protein [Streptomyces sp. NPDC059166]|uniref:ATP-binding cassette domain-containing protein n=1 Tax=Streptomyces sp. NPDC059166 TaxID=3346752 RepID=UPI0036C63F9C
MRATGVHHAYRRRQILRGVDLTLEPGVLAGIVGENGAGKSTLLRILSGELRPQRGAVSHRGRLGSCPQRAILNEALTPRQHLDLFRSAYRMDGAGRTEELVEQLGFRDSLDASVGELSGGTRQKLNLTLALIHDPQVLLLDEPYQGFDWETHLRFWQLAARLRDEGRSVLVVSHLAHDLQRFDKVWNLTGGVLCAASKEPV